LNYAFGLYHNRKIHAPTARLHPVSSVKQECRIAGRSKAMRMTIPTTPIPKEEYERFGDEVYVSDSLIEKYHTAAGLTRFRGWSIQVTQLLMHGKSVYFPGDYEKWIELGMPDRSPGDGG
jgi:hypothetical protein